MWKKDRCAVFGCKMIALSREINIEVLFLPEKHA